MSWRILRAIRDALTPPELPQRPGLELAAAFLPAAAEKVSGDFYLVAEGPQDSTVLVVGDVVGHGLPRGGVPRSYGRRSPRPPPSPMILAAC
jgi:serine phosphatase RsbU (regulator of sigma subunit)